MSEWRHDCKPPFISSTMEVWLKNGDVRIVHRPWTQFNSLYFLDCIHEAQNAYCSESKVVAWRILERKK